MRIELRHCQIEFTSWGARTRFPDGTHVDGTPHDTHHYAVISHRLGYGDDLLRYAQEHEFAHAFWAERIGQGPSDVLWCLAHGREPERAGALEEEMAAQTCQRWWRANERPILSGCDWDELRRDALAILDA